MNKKATLVLLGGVVVSLATYFYFKHKKQSEDDDKRLDSHAEESKQQSRQEALATPSPREEDNGAIADLSAVKEHTHKSTVRNDKKEMPMKTLEEVVQEDKELYEETSHTAPESEVPTMSRDGTQVHLGASSEISVEIPLSTGKEEEEKKAPTQEEEEKVPEIKP